MKRSPEQEKNFSGRLANTEKEETTFSFIKKATNLASNHHPANVIANALIRMEARKIIKDGYSETEKNRIKADNNIPTNQVSFKKHYYTIHLDYKIQIPVSMSPTKPGWFQAEVCWWRELEDGIEFFDISNCPNSKK